MNEIINIIWITLLPFLELRASIPYGILKAGLGWPLVFIVAVITNIILGILLFLFMDMIIKVIVAIKPIGRLWDKYVERTQKMIHQAVEKYGELAVAVFIGIPLPGSGVYSGALAAYLIGLSKRKFFIANIIGVLIAAIIVTLIVVLGAGAFNIFLKQI